MKRLLPALLLGALACAAVDTAVSPDQRTPAFDRRIAPDTTQLPDLVVDSKATQNNWVTRVEDFPAEFCSVQEGGISAGTHKVVRFTVMTPNIGKGDVFVGSPLKHMDPNGDGDFADQDGMYEFASCHHHFHFKYYATYRLLDGNGKEWKAAKRGFCMLDTDPYNVNNGDGNWKFRNCGTVESDGYQGISSGWADTYTFDLGGQFFVLDGGDGQPPVPPGTYTIEVNVNPAYAPPAGGVCPLVTDPKTGECHQFAESDYTNNIGRSTVIITDHPGRAGYGPLKNSPQNTKKSDEIEG